jgi:sugar phosphate isomerase/epimerase
VVTLCTGTRDPESMWRSHPDNTTPDAWADLRRTLEPLLDAASIAGVHLGVEPEPGNVVRDAPTAAQLLAELGADAPIGIVLDPANLLTPANVGHQDEIIGEAIDLLGDRIVGAQAKDVVASGYSAPGAGLMDYPAVFAQLARIAPVPLIVQDASEADAARVRTDMLRWATPGLWV